VNFRVALIVMVAFFVGGYLGSIGAVHLPVRVLKVAFGLLIIVLGVRMVFSK
jgi:uncharacterized membrane protein YfcA